jgi:hypothetical protein
MSSGNALPEPTLVATSLFPYSASTLTADVMAAAEPYEGVLCKYENVSVTTAPDNHQEFYVNDGSGPGQVDDNGYQYPHTWAGVTVGTSWDRLVGIVDYNFNLFGLNPRNNSDMYTVSNQDYVVLPNASLIGNFPNPFVNQTEITYNLKTTQDVTIQVFNTKGQKVRTLVNGTMNAQLHNVTFDGRADDGSLLPAGVYMYQLTAGNHTDSKKLIIR